MKNPPQLVNLNFKFFFYLINFTFILNCSTHATEEYKAYYKQGTRLENELLREVLIATGKESFESKIAELKTVLAKNEKILGIILTSKEISGLVIQESVRSFFPDQISNYEKDLQSLKDSIHEYLKVAPFSFNPYPAYAVLKQEIINAPKNILINKIHEINPYYENDHDLNTAGKDLVLKILLEYLITDLNNKFTRLSFERKLELLNYIPDNVFITFINRIEYHIEKINFSASPAIKIMTGPKEGISLTKAPPKIQQFFRKVLLKYFDTLPIKQKRNILICLLENDNKLPIEKTSCFLKYSGIAMQKIFQLLSKEVKSPRLEKVMEELKSNIPPMPYHEVQEIIESELKQNINDIFTSFSKVPLGAATVGQVHLAEISGSEVVVKIQRPGLAERANREFETLREFTMQPTILQLIDDLEKSLLEELDFTLEEQNICKGQIYKNQDSGINPIQCVGSIPATKKVLIMSKAGGNPINKFPKTRMIQKKEVLLFFLEVWFRNAIFGNGFFHGDLHGGNLFFSIEEATRFNTELGNYLTAEEGGHFIPPIEVKFDKNVLYPLDFGNSSTLTKKEQIDLLKIMLGIALNAPNAIRKGLTGHTKLSKSEQFKLRRDIKRIIQLDNSDHFQKMNLILSKAVEKDISIPKNFVLFNRGRVFLEQQIDEIDDFLVKIGAINQSDKKSYLTVYKKIIIEKISEALIYELLGMPDPQAKINGRSLYLLIKEYLAPPLIQIKKQIRNFCNSSIEFIWNTIYQTNDQLNIFLENYGG